VVPELSVAITQKRWACVLDPTLALSIYGLPLVTRLGRVMEVWVGRELWHILDNTHFYLQRPDTLLSSGSEDAESVAVRSQVVINALREWEHIRLESDPGRQNCYWIGDGPLESFLPEEQEPEIVWRYEAISASLDRRLSDTGTLPSAYRDTASLAVSLPAAFVLTHIPPESGHDAMPGICQTLDGWGISCQTVATDDPWRRKESEILYQTLVQAGLGKWAWSGLRAAVLHLAAPAALTAIGCNGGGPGYLEGEFAHFEPAEQEQADYWRDAQGYWYPL